MKPKLLIVELWGLGDLVIATPFIRAASEKFAVTLVAKPYAEDLQKRFWPGVTVSSFVAPWTAFTAKYRLFGWPWKRMYRLHRHLAGVHFDVGLSARWDPRDHILLALAGVRERIGFPRVQSQVFLTRALTKPAPPEHRSAYWEVLGRALDLELPPLASLRAPRAAGQRAVLVHSGAGQPVRVWPLERYRTLVTQLRHAGWPVILACDADQREWWLQAGEKDVATPRRVTELFALVDQSGVFVGNDSGPGHLAAFCGVPTFTIFGPQLPEWFAPLHPASEWLEGKACPYKPCSDYCRFATAHCLGNITQEEAGALVTRFVSKHLGAPKG